MIKNNKDIFKEAAELYHRFVETKEVSVNEAKAGAAILAVCQKSILIDIMEAKMGKGMLEISNPGEVEGKMFIKKVR